MSCTPPLLAKRISWRIYKEYEKKGYIVQRIAQLMMLIYTNTIDLTYLEIDEVTSVILVPMRV